MKHVLMTLVLIMLMAVPVSALEVEAPAVPESAREFMPEAPESFGQGLMEVLRDALMKFHPNLKEGTSACLGILAAVLIVSVVKTLPGTPERAVDLAGTAAIGILLLHSANSMVNLAVETVTEISEYGKLLLPVMTTALAAQGGISASAALYAGTAVFDSILSSLISKLLTPMIYLFLALAVAAAAVGEEALNKLRDQLKGLMIWILKTLMYMFTGYISITGVVSGTTDAAALKAAKLTISGAVPVVVGILSDASEAVLVTAGTVKNAAGLYGLFAVLAIWLEPFLKIGAQYLLLKGTGLVCGMFGSKQHTGLVQDFCTAMGLLLGMTGSVCLLLLISLVCFLKGGL